MTTILAPLNFWYWLNFCHYIQDAVLFLINYLGSGRRQLPRFLFGYAYTYDSHNRSGHQYKDSVKLKITSILRMLPVGLGKWPHSRCLDPLNQYAILLDQNSTDLISVWSTLTGGHDNVSGRGYQCQFRCCIQKKRVLYSFFHSVNDSATVGSLGGRSGKSLPYI